MICREPSFLSLQGRQMVFWPDAGRWASSPAFPWVVPSNGGRRQEGLHSHLFFLLRWYPPRGAREWGSCHGKPPTSRGSAVSLHSQWVFLCSQEPLSPGSLSRWELHTAILRNGSRNRYAHGNISSPLAVLRNSYFLILT